MWRDLPVIFLINLRESEGWPLGKLWGQVEQVSIDLGESTARVDLIGIKTL